MRRSTAAVAQHDELGRLLAALGHPQQGAHLTLLHPRLVEHLALQAGLLRHGAGALGEFGGGEDVSWLVRQVAGEVGCLREHRSALRAPPQRLDPGLVELDERQLADLRPVVVRLLVAVKGVEAKDGAFGDRLSARLRIEAGDAGAVGDGGERLAAETAGLAGGGRGDVAYLIDRELLLLAQAGDDDARRRQLAQRVDDGELVLLAPAIAVLDHLRDGAVQRLIDGAGATARAGHAFEQVDDDGSCAVLGDVAAFDSDLQCAVPPRYRSDIVVTASASISTSISGSIRRLTSTMVVAGRISRNTSPCALPMASQSSMFVT